MIVLSNLDHSNNDIYRLSMERRRENELLFLQTFIVFLAGGACQGFPFCGIKGAPMFLTWQVKRAEMEGECQEEGSGVSHNSGKWQAMYNIRKHKAHWDIDALRS